MRKSSFFILPAIGALALAAGCSSSGGGGGGGGQTDGGALVDGGGGGKADIGPLPDGAPKPKALDCTGTTCRDFVFDRIRIPKSTETKKLAFDLDCDGDRDNRLGDVLSLMSTFGSKGGAQASIDEQINQGKLILLMKMAAASLTSGKAAAQLWIGEQATCCKSPKDAKACAAEAKKTCFGGSFSFKKSPKSPSDLLFGGAIKAGVATFGPSSFQLTIPLSSAGTVSLPLERVFLGGKLSADGKAITEGRLGGAITTKDFEGTVLPAVAKLLTDLSKKNAAVKTFLKDQLKDDGKVTADELKKHPLIKTFLSPDIDLDRDGTNDAYSIGVGWSAVSAKIAK